MDEDDWIQLYRRHMPPLYRAVSRRLGGHREFAEDVTQETWLRALRTWLRDGVPESPDRWLITVASNLVRNHFRRPSAETDAALDRLPAADDPGAESHRADAIQRGLARLRPGQAELLVARHIDGTTLRELASAGGLTERAVEGRLRRARAALSQHVGPDALDQSPWTEKQ